MLESAYEAFRMLPESFGFMATCLTIGCLFFLFVLRVVLLRRARLAWKKRPAILYPNFPKTRQVLLEKTSAPGCAQTCSTNEAFQYQFPDMFAFDLETPVPLDGESSPMHGSSDYVYKNYSGWKQEAPPMFIHPSAPEELPMELWLPEDLSNNASKGSNVAGNGAVSDAMEAGGYLISPQVGAVYPNPVPNSIQNSAEPHTQWSKHIPDPLSDLETVLFSEKADHHTHVRIPAQDASLSSSASSSREHSQESLYTPPMTAASKNAVWHTPPELFAPVSDLEAGCGELYSEHPDSTHSPMISFNSYAEDYSHIPKHSSIDNLHEQSHIHHQHNQHSQKHLQRQLQLKGQHYEMLQQRQNHNTYSLPSPPHSARGGSDSGSDTNDENTFKCPNCSASFRIRGYLTRHMKKHAEIMKFNCPFYKCLKDNHKCHQTGGFSRRDTFKMHLKARHFAYPNGTARKNRPNCAGRCCGCNKLFENNELWIENHLLAGECPMDSVHQYTGNENIY